MNISQQETIYDYWICLIRNYIIIKLKLKYRQLLWFIISNKQEPALYLQLSIAFQSNQSNIIISSNRYQIHSKFISSYLFYKIKSLNLIRRLKKILKLTFLYFFYRIKYLSSFLCAFQLLYVLFIYIFFVTQPVPLIGISFLIVNFKLKYLVLRSGIKAKFLFIFLERNLSIIINLQCLSWFINIQTNLNIKRNMIGYQSSLQTHNPDLFSQVRRSLNGLKEKQPHIRKQAINQLKKIVQEEQLSSSLFEQIAHLALKDLLKIMSDKIQYNREHSLIIIIQLLQRCTKITAFLPYIFAVLIDRTNCNDLEGILNVPEKMRPAPGQKPKVLIKLIQNCQQIRILYCKLMDKILSLVEQNQIRDKLDQIVNIIRALIMDPSPQIQKNACQTLQFFCKNFKLLLLHYTQIMGRAVLLPLVSKKSKIRIAGLNTLTAIFWCGLWKYNAFVFQNLIGFRDPNSVPIKDFYQPTNNINYFATFVNDQNIKVRQQFMRHIKIWVCDIDDKYDHHGRVVPYIMSGLFDKDNVVKTTALQIIKEIGRQIQIQKQKDFRQNKQYAIDASWTWNGKLVNLPVLQPINVRPSLGSRVFVRGHVRKFWTALYKEIKDINYENRIRAAYLIVYGTVYTENYMSQYLDIMLPNLLSSILPIDEQDKAISDLIKLTLFYIGRYCEVTSYIHIMSSAIKGQLIQNQQFMKASLVGLTKLLEGAMQAIPNDTGLSHRKEHIIKIINLIDECSICNQIYHNNSQQSMNLVLVLLKGLKQKATPQQINEIFEQHCISILKLFSVSYYQLNFSNLEVHSFKATSNNYQFLKNQFKIIGELYSNYFDTLQSFMSDSYMNPPTLMDPDWKLIIIIHNFLTQAETQKENLVFQLAQDVICQSIKLNKSIELLTFLFKYIPYLFDQTPDKVKLSKLHLVVLRSLEIFNQYKPMKKVPIYDQHLVPPETDPSVIRINQDIFLPLYTICSEAIQTFYINKISIPVVQLGKIIFYYLKMANKFVRHNVVCFQAIKTLWIIFERANLNQNHIDLMHINQNGQKKFVFENIINFVIERIQTFGDPDQKKLNMLFDIFQLVVKCCPKIIHAAIKLPSFYLHYPQLLEKLFKYAMDQKNLEAKQKYRGLLISLCSKLKPWFEIQYKTSESTQRFARANLLRSILQQSRY